MKGIVCGGIVAAMLVALGASGQQTDAARREGGVETWRPTRMQLVAIGSASGAAVLLVTAAAIVLIGRNRKRTHLADARREPAELRAPEPTFRDCVLEGVDGQLSLALPGAKLPEAAGGVTVGRNPQYAQVVIDDKNVSRAHARFIARNQEVLVEDLSSTNGTFVSGVKVEPGRRQLIRPNDRIRISHLEFVFRQV